MASEEFAWMKQVYQIKNSSERRMLVIFERRLIPCITNNKCEKHVDQEDMVILIELCTRIDKINRINNFYLIHLIDLSKMVRIYLHQRELMIH